MAYNGAGDDGYEHHQLHEYNQEQQHPTGVSAPFFHIPFEVELHFV